jgi:hypothetical protein
LSETPVHCPSCGAPAAGDPPACSACGWRTQTAREHLWLRAGGSAVILLGFVLGAVGVAIQGAPPGHWSESLAGWFPIGPWGGAHHWLSFLVAGILLTLAGLGVTRRLPAAWLAAAAAVVWEAGWTVLALSGLAGRAGAPAAAGALLAAEGIFLLLVLRIGLALLRTRGGQVRNCRVE